MLIALFSTEINNLAILRIELKITFKRKYFVLFRVSNSPEMRVRTFSLLSIVRYSKATIIIIIHKLYLVFSIAIHFSHKFSI